MAEKKKQKHEKPAKKVEVCVPGYEELLGWCRINIQQLLQIGYVNSDEHIERHFGGESGLLDIINGYVELAGDLMELARMAREAEDAGNAQDAQAQETPPGDPAAA